MKIEWNKGQKHPNGCCSEEAFKWCHEHGYTDGVFCWHPDKDEKTCREIAFERRAKVS